MRPEEGDAARLWDIADAARKILRSVEGLTLTELVADEDRRDLIVYRLALIGEASNRISDSLRAQHPEVPWRRMVNQRNVLIHAYDEIDYDLVWQVVQNELRSLIVKIESIMPPIPDTTTLK